MRHSGIDFTGELNESGDATNFLRLPCEVEGVDRNAVATKSWAWIERHESERFGASGGDYFPDINVHVCEHGLHFIDKRNVDRAEDVLKKFGCFSHFGAGNKVRLADHAAVQGVCQLAGYFVGATNQLRNHRGGEVWVTRIFTLWAVRQEEVFVAFQSSGVKNWTHLIARGAWVGGAFQHDQLPLAEDIGNKLGGVKNEREVWLFVMAKRCWHANQNRVGLLEVNWICGA